MTVCLVVGGGQTGGWELREDPRTEGLRALGRGGGGGAIWA